jgi:hypothetical protein
VSAPLCQGADGGPGACGSAAELPLWRLLEANIARVSRQEKGAVLMAKDREGVFGVQCDTMKDKRTQWGILIMSQGSPRRTFGNGLGDKGHEIIHREALSYRW